MNPKITKPGVFAAAVLAAALALVMAMAPRLEAEPQTRVPTDRAEITLSFAPVVRQTAPAVVNIYARRVVEDRRGPFAGDPFFGDLFGGFGPPTPRVQNALGSGVIVAPDGIVVSNYHVVGGASDIRVVLTDRREYAARVILADEDSDLAVLQLDGATDLPALTLQDSDRAEVGELVLAIGNPFGVGQTVSSGIISGLARSGIALGSGRGYFIQTDAAINPGNSGGALVDMQGQLVGVNTAILTRSGGSLGIGFAVPSNLVAQVIAQAQAGNDRFVRPWAGISAQTLDPALADAFGMTIPEGVVITDMHADSPFAAAGLRAGDVLRAVDGAPVNSAPEMMFRLAATGIGGVAGIDVLRADGSEGAVQVNLIPPPEIPARAPRTIRANTALRGLSIVTINPAVIAEWNLPLDARGALVTDLRDMAARTGLRRGDILLAINGQPIADSTDAERAAQDTGRTWHVEALRDGRRVSLRFRL
ncbi:trypsin-like peptidase domain-containing protein [Rhodobacteraceae bacterium 2376]|uniref:Trypsin-like peptidase domain-containing protein n=1 Tax=Rhabdonatronobacter sediminivivens TaxID=2743469 RepID=A0A7Z0I2Y0_9RHOB|nr:trypsin-like peptidase domain-containing protein [Rhabdonatronobacter sediminivivens]NYS26597.1 trypsin-like peptidase domain-containing protein [Rhabdonatronobacter sediminivivens]